MLKAVVSYAPKISVSYNNIRSIGDYFGILSSQAPDALSQLTDRDIKCFQNEPSEAFGSCIDKSEDVYIMCKDAPNSSECFEAQQTYDSFLDRMKFWRNNEWSACRGVDAYSLPDCRDKRESWKNLCDLDFESKECLNAEAILKDGQQNGFKNFWDNSGSGYWGNWGKNSHAIPDKQACKDAVKDITGNADSTLKEIKKAFRSKARTVHPDHRGSNEKMQKLNLAYEKATKCIDDKIL